MSKNDVSQYHPTSNMVNGPNTVQVITAASLPDLLITAKAIEFEEVSLSYMENLKTFC